MYFCVKCGKPIESGVLCSEHDTTITVAEKYNLKACECGRFKTHNRWTKSSSPETFLKKILKNDCIISNPKVTDVQKSKIILMANELEYVIAIEKCDICQRQHSQYFEGMIQLRYNSQIAPRVELDLAKQVKFWADKQVFVTKEHTNDEGKDLWLTSKKDMSVFSDKLQRKYGCVVVKSAKLFSRNKQTSKNIYRLNILVKFPEFMEGSIIFVNNKIAKVLQLRRQIKALDLKTGKTFGFFLKDGPKILKTQSTVVSKIRPQLTILDPENYEEVNVANPLITDKTKSGDKVSVILHENKYYLIP